MHSYIPVLGMAFERNHIIDKLKSFSPLILEHLCKCILYGRSVDRYDHWIKDEIATWIVDASKMSLDKGKKLKKNDYDRYLFGALGTDRIDAEPNLDYQYAQDRRERYPYPEVDITDDMYDNMFEASVAIRSKFCEQLARKGKLDKTDVTNDLHEILDKYCK